MLESKNVWAPLQPQLKNRGIHALRIESSTSVGQPDVNMAADGREVWVELKAIRKGNKPKFETSQRIWVVKRYQTGLRNFCCFARKGDEFQLWGAESFHSLLVPRARVPPDIRFSKPWDWDAIVRRLLEAHA